MSQVKVLALLFLMMQEYQMIYLSQKIMLMGQSQV